MLASQSRCLYPTIEASREGISSTFYIVNGLRTADNMWTLNSSLAELCVPVVDFTKISSVRLNDHPVTELTRESPGPMLLPSARRNIRSPNAIYESHTQRCILMATDPGDLVLDPTCGSGTTAYVAEQWGRRWITIDTSRVALALARSRVMGARYPYYLLADSVEGRRKEAELSQTVPSESVTSGDIRQGFVYERVPHVTLKSIANNAEIDVIHERWQETLEPLRAALNAALDRIYEEWEIPREPGDPWPAAAAAAWQRTQDAPTDAAKATALRALNRALNRTYSPATVPDRPLDPWDAGPADLHRRWWDARIAPPAGDRRLHRRQGGLRVPLRQALRRSGHRARGRPVHRGKPGAAPHLGRGRGRRPDRPPRRAQDRLRRPRPARLRRHDPRKPAHRRRPAGAQGRPHLLHRPHPLAGQADLRRRALPRGRPRHRRRTARRRLHRPPSSAPSPAPTWPPPPAKPPTPTTTC